MLRTFALVCLAVSISTIDTAIAGEKTVFLYKDRLHLTPDAVTSINLLLGIPAYLQFFIGAWTSVVPWLGYHRRSYYCLGAIIVSLAYAGLALLPHYLLSPVVTLFLVAASGGVLRVVVYNSVIVAVGNRTGAYPRFASLAQFIPLVYGLAFTSHMAGYVATNWTYSATYGAVAALALLHAPLLLLIDDTRVIKGTDSPQERMAELRADRWQAMRNLRAALSNRSTWILVALVGFVALTPAPNTAIPYYETDALHFSKQFIGDLGRYTSAGNLIGVLGFAALTGRLSPRLVAIGYVISNCVIYLCLMSLHSPNSARLMLFFYGMDGVLSNLLFVLLIARSSPPGFEAPFWGLFNSVNLLLYNLCDKWGSWMYDYFGPSHHHSIAHGWYVSQSVGLAMAIAAFGFVPFLPRRSVSADPTDHDGAANEAQDR